eukprot:5212263-Prorocentrum_lima.AAC.1
MIINTVDELKVVPTMEMLMKLKKKDLEDLLFILNESCYFTSNYTKKMFVENIMLEFDSMEKKEDEKKKKEKKEEDDEEKEEKEEKEEDKLSLIHISEPTRLDVI